MAYTPLHHYKYLYRQIPSNYMFRCIIGDTYEKAFECTCPGRPVVNKTALDLGTPYNFTSSIH